MRLDMGMGMQMRPELKQMILAPRMIQSMEILQLPIMALQERIEQELQENPVLELKEASTRTSRSADEAASKPNRRATAAETRKANWSSTSTGDNEAGLRPPRRPQPGLGRPLQRGASPLAATASTRKATRSTTPCRTWRRGRSRCRIISPTSSASSTCTPEHAER